MPFVPVPGGAEATVHYTLDGQDIENVICFSSELGTVTETDVNALAVALFNWISTDFILNMPQALAGSFLTVRAVDVPDGPVGVTGLGGVVGGIVDDPMPNEVTIAISFRSAVGGRSGRGRSYTPALPRSNVTGNQVDNALLDNIRTSWSGLNDVITGTGFQHAVFHRFSGSTIVGGKKVPTPLTTGVARIVTSWFFVDNIVDSQRRRGPGRGR